MIWLLIFIHLNRTVHYFEPDEKDNKKLSVFNVCVYDSIVFYSIDFKVGIGQFQIGSE